ncbi:alpha/beta hydrolase, partial [Streptomyces sp. NPDC057654]
MAQEALPERGAARLGKPVGTAGPVHGVALLLPTGEASGTRRPSPLPSVAMRPLARRIARAGRPEGLVVHVVHYRFRGWNGASAHPARDAE